MKEFMSKSDIFHKNPKKLMEELQTFLGKNKNPNQHPQSSQRILAVSIPNFPQNAFINKSIAPGPGTHDNQYAKSKKNGYKFGGSKKEGIFEIKTKGPSPGQYHTDKINRARSAPSHKIGNSQRPPLIQGTCLKSPAPGVYDFKPKIGEGPKVQIKGSNYDPFEKERKLIPGAGTYEPIHIPKKKAPQYKIGTGQRHDFTKNSQGVPPPGTYEIKEKVVTPSYGFGTSNRPPLSKPTDSPGPGGYEIP